MLAQLFKLEICIKSHRSKPCIQVKYAKPMRYDEKNDELNEGSVTYEYFFEKGIVEPVTVSQMDFLKILIYGVSN